MTHYAVLVVGRANTLREAEQLIEDYLDPYDENMEVEPYKKYMDEDDIKRMMEHYGIAKEIDPDWKDLLIEKTPDWCGSIGGYDDEGIYYLSTYNPDSKWDWWSLGGRYSGMLDVREGADKKRYKYGRSGIFDNEVGVDLAFADVIEWEGMGIERRERLIETWQKFHDEYDKKKKEFGEDEEKLEKETNILNWIYGVDPKDTLQEYLDKKASESPLITYAVLDKNGWSERAKMGWWAITYDETEDEETWKKKFHERFLSDLKEDTFLAVVDCHI